MLNSPQRRWDCKRVCSNTRGVNCTVCWSYGDIWTINMYIYIYLHLQVVRRHWVSWLKTHLWTLLKDSASHWERIETKPRQSLWWRSGCPWSKGHGFEPGQVELRVHNTSVCHTWAKNVNYQYIILRDLHMLTSDLRDNVAVHEHFF